MKKQTKRERYAQESILIDQYLDKIGADNALYVDIGCGNISNISLDRIHASKQTIFFECDPVSIGLYDKWDESNFKMIPSRVTPDNVVGLIKENSNSGDFKLLDLDIDGYDFFVLKSILEVIPPSIIVAEVNEKIPPPIEFAVKYSPYYGWDGSHFFGMSVSKFYSLMKEFRYDVVNLNFNNIYAIKSDLNHGCRVYTDEEVYDIGYKSLRLNGDAPQFNYNKNVDCLLTMSPQEVVKFLKDHFSKYEGLYELE